MWGSEGIRWQYEEDESKSGFLYRMLGGEEYDLGEDYEETDDVPLHYRFLSLGILTLYLILFVEFLRHSIDHAARGRPFFTAVLLMVYSELATLGIVEFGVFLLVKYNYVDKEKKKKFADVHFALFLTALFNALQYSLTSIVSTRLSNGLWVKTEQLELDHYVEIREEYERVQEIMDLHYTGYGKWVRNCVLFVCKPGLRRRHESLRVQVRFHELRLHFLEFNNLFYSLKVSEYLKRSELSILIGLVHVSVGTWVLLIGILNLGYFVLGMIGNNTQDARLMAALLTVLFIVIEVSFIVLSLALRYKMRQIFRTVMKTKVIETSDHEEGIKNQKHLFWFGSPSLVVKMIQLMNFGYAVLLSIVLIYWEYLSKSPLPAEIYLIISVGCYVVFLYNLSALLPEYTLCTSLGYLTNRKELQETVAKHRLVELKRQRRKIIIENAAVHDTSIIQAVPVLQNSGDVSLSDSLSRGLNNGSLHGDVDTKTQVLVSDLVKLDTKALRRNLPEDSRKSLRIREERIRQRRLSRKKSISDGVAAMRAWNQGSERLNSQETNGKKKRNHGQRARLKKTMSQPGVIQGWQNITALEPHKNKPHSLDDTDATVIGRSKHKRRSSSDPRVIQDWKNSLLLERTNTDFKGMISSEDEGPTPSVNDAEMSNERNKDPLPQWKIDRSNRLAARRRARKKSQSASAIIQSWQDHSAHVRTKDNFEASSDENYNSSDLRALSSDEGSDDNTLASKVKNSRFYGENSTNQAPFSKRQFNLRTLNEIEDQSQASPPSFKDTVTASASKMVLEISDGVLIGDEKRRDHLDDKTIDTGKSDGNLSDIDVIQAETVGTIFNSEKAASTIEINKSWPTLIIDEMRLYFIGSLYPNVSHVVGTSIVFAFIGYRLEVMLTKAQNMNDEESSSFHVAFFWLEAIFLFCFMASDFIILILFPICKFKSEIEHRLCLAATFDILLVGIVSTLFFVAEAKRCCTEQSSSHISNVDNIEEYVFDSDCTCPRWGARTYGGIGMIEPFTSLIFLRIFRFQFAQFLCTTFNQKIDSNSKNDTNMQKKSKSSGRDNGHEEKSGSALELWERAIVEFPDIVEKYGHFSGELLQAMLGLDVGMESASTLNLEQPVTRKESMRDSSTRVNMEAHIKLSEPRYSKLPPRAQGIIIAGGVQQPVKPMDPKVLDSSLARTGLVEFEVDKEQLRLESKATYTFIAPFARLVRSMRRCDRRHLPLLKEWISVDVVMTQFEIVYFEAIDTYATDLDEKSKLQFEACRLALQATKGGKNLRLCDVALGRKVIGHLDFADVTEVHVTKDDVPVSDMTLVEKAAGFFDKEQDLDVEHWSSLQPDTEANKKYARVIRWALIQEERLKISTTSGTLYFRFYSDLARFEAKSSEQSSTGLNVVAKDIAFQWAETISRICGRNQLKQYLPHFGEENEAELRDYLEVVHFHEKEAENERKQSIRGLQNVGNVERLFVGTKECGTGQTRGKHKRIKSMMEIGTAEMYDSNLSQEEVIFYSPELEHQHSKSMTDLEEQGHVQHNECDSEVFRRAKEAK